MISLNFDKVIRDIVEFDQLNPSAMRDIQAEFSGVDRFMSFVRPHLEAHLIDKNNPHLLRGSQILKEQNDDWYFGGTDVNSAILIYDDSVSKLSFRRNNQTFFDSTTSEHVWNDSGFDTNFRIEGDTDQNLFFLDAGLDRIGIGTATPDTKFTVSGAAKVTSTLVVNDNVYLTNDKILHWADSLAADFPAIVLDSSDIFTINPSGWDIDTRIEGDTDADLIYVDAGNDRVGIGTATPGQKLEVNGAILIPNNTSYLGKDTGGSARNLIKYGTNNNVLIGDNQGTGTDQWYAGGSIVLHVDGSTSSLNMLGLYSTPLLVFNDGGQDMDMRWESVSSANALFWDGNNGRLGIGGTSVPSSELNLYNSGGNARPILTFEHEGDNIYGGFIIFRHKRSTGSTASANDVAGSMRWQAWDATATPVEQQYITLQGRVLSTGSGYVEGQLRVFAMDTAGSNNVVLQLGQGLQLGIPTGGDKGLGTINVAGDIYKNNTAYTNPDYVLEHWVTGEIKKYADRPGAKDYVPMSIYEIEAYINKHWRLPGITDDPAGVFDMADKALELIERLYAVTIEQQYKLDQLERRMNDLLQ